MTGDVTPYLALITSEHAIQPDFRSVVEICLQPAADAVALLGTFPALFDIDRAEGDQLDIIGQWVGISRYVKTAITGVYFSFGTAGLGFGEGIWRGPGDPTTGLIALPDDIFLLLLKAKIAANSWDGTVPGAYAIWQSLFGPYGYQILIQDNGDMTMTLGLVGTSINPTFKELFVGGYLDLRPAGVKIDGYFMPSVDGAPFFGFGPEGSVIAGFGTGAWAASS